MKCEAINFHPDHIRGFPMRPIFLEGALESIETVARAKDSFVATITFDGKPVAFIGMKLIWRGVGHVWSVTSDEITKAPAAFHKIVLEKLEEYQRIFMLWRVQMFVRAKYKPGIRWAESLGFKNEGLMAKFDPEGHDYFRFAKVKDHG